MRSQSFATVPRHAAQERAIARTIACRYGDGGVYVPRESARRELLHLAVADGYVSSDGFLTRKGRRLLARFEV